MEEPNESLEIVRHHDNELWIIKQKFSEEVNKDRLVTIYQQIRNARQDVEQRIMDLPERKENKKKQYEDELNHAEKFINEEVPQAHKRIDEESKKAKVNMKTLRNRLKNIDADSEELLNSLTKEAEKLKKREEVFGKHASKYLPTQEEVEAVKVEFESPKEEVDTQQDPKIE